MKDLSNPKTVTEVRMAIGLFSYYRRFIKNFATIAEPLYQLTKKNQFWEWTDSHQNAFDTLKTKLTSAPVLVQPNLEQTFILQTDASDEGLGAVLTQKDSEGQEHPIAFASRKLSALELKYTTTEKECLAV